MRVVRIPEALPALLMPVVTRFVASVLAMSVALSRICPETIPVAIVLFVRPREAAIRVPNEPALLNMGLE